MQFPPLIERSKPQPLKPEPSLAEMQQVLMRLRFDPGVVALVKNIREARGLINWYHTAKRRSPHKQHKALANLDPGYKSPKVVKREASIAYMYSRNPEGLRNRPDVIQAYRAMPYREYLQTEWWKRIKKAAIRRANFACQRCHKRAPLDVHHKTYDRLGTEHDQDLEALCRDCHNIEHTRT